MVNIIAIVGLSSTGKDTIAKILSNDLNIELLVSSTTRPIRENEKHGNPYNFFSEEEFLNDVYNNKYIEYRVYNTLYSNKEEMWYYGTRKDSLQDNKTYIVTTEIQGLLEFKKLQNIKTISFLIHVPYDLRLERAINRGSFDGVEWNRRKLDDEERFGDISTNQFCDYIVENIDIDNSINIIKEKINSLGF